jgi:hypothetical protein
MISDNVTLNMPSSVDIIISYEVKKDEMGRVCSTNGEKRNAYRIFVGMHIEYLWESQKERDR